MHLRHLLLLPLVATSSVTTAPALRKCKYISPPSVPGADLVSISTAEVQGGNVCSINVTLTHPGVGDKVKIWVWLPTEKKWNGRFQGIGGGGWVAGGGEPDLVLPAGQGYAAASTNGGGQDWFPEGADGPDLGLFADFAARSLHEMAVVGKHVAKSFYGREPHHSYWNGCSTGGRQGHMLAQRYPGDFNGILAAAPVLYWPTMILAILWPDFVLNYLDVLPSQCELAVFQKAAIEKCDALDGVVDGIIGNLEDCTFDPLSVVGTRLKCYGKQTTITREVAQVVKLVHQGPRSPTGKKLWDGYDYGANYDYMIRTITTNGTTGLYNETSNSLYVRYFLQKMRDFDVNTIDSLEEVTDLFATAHAEYGGLIGSDNPDLTAFREGGGKLMSWHGLADNLIMANNSIRYRRQVEQVMGGNDRVNEFYRLFMAPGVGHCESGYGPIPTAPLDALVDWVEYKKVPATLKAGFTDGDGRNVTRNLCPWPLVSKYKGTGNKRSAASYTCATSY